MLNKSSLIYFKLTKIANLIGSDLGTQVRFVTLAKNAFLFTTFWSVTRNNYITSFDRGYTFSNGLYNSSSFMTGNTEKDHIITVESTLKVNGAYSSLPIKRAGFGDVHKLSHHFRGG